MFYYPYVLQRHTGCFSTIWLAATSGIRVTRKDLLKVNVNRTCNDIVDYVTADVPPPQPNLPRPRFSLYLSSQLQYGVVVVYHKQCGFLLEEIQHTIDRLLRTKRCIYLDMAEPDRLTLNVPDNMCLMEAAEGAQDPFFGLMNSHQLPSPYKIHQQVMVIEAEGSQHSLVPSAHSTLDKVGFRSPPAAISMTEKEQFVITAAEGDDFPEATPREIDLLMDQPDHFHGAVEQQTDERMRTHEGAMSSIDQLKETVLAAERDSVWLLDEESGHPVKVPQAAVALEMTPQQVAMPTPPSRASGKEGDTASQSPYDEVTAPPQGKPGGGRRRQLVFSDPRAQISEKTMREQIGDLQGETLELYQVLLGLSSTKCAAPAQLFSSPCGPLPHPDLLSLWKHCASLPTLHELREEEEARVESEQDREILRTERKRRYSSMREISSESGPQLTEGSSALDVILDMSKEEKSMSDVNTPVSRWSPQEEAQLRMDPIAEEIIEMPEVQTGTEGRDMLSWISLSLQRFGEVTFDSLVAPEADRTTAAHALHTLLVLLSARQVRVHQRKPYGDITISPAAVRVTA